MNGNEKEIKLPKLISMADVEEKEAEWLTPNYLARACINMMAGDGGSGKTTTWCGIAAGVSAGMRVFFDAVPEEFAKCEPQKVLFFSSEDSVEHTLRARLRKAGANLNNILSVNLQDESFGEIKFNSPILEKMESVICYMRSQTMENRERQPYLTLWRNAEIKHSVEVLWCERMFLNVDGNRGVVRNALDTSTCISLVAPDSYYEAGTYVDVAFSEKDKSFNAKLVGITPPEFAPNDGAKIY